MLMPETLSGTILVADDERGNRELFSEILRAYGFDVVCAEDGEQALALLRSRPIDLALLDVMMPRRSGYAVCRAAKSQPETRLIPVVLCTGLDSREDRLQGIECGADDFLNKPVDQEELLARVRTLVRLKHFTDELESAETVLTTLALSIEAKDPYTGGHCQRLAQYSVALAEQFGLPEAQRLALRRASTVHDIGKVAVPESILLKPGPLTPEERKVMEQHVLVGERICAPLKSFRDVLPIIRHHHERMDGSGYPDGLSGEQIPIAARIFAVVDVHDALISPRPFRPAWTKPAARAYIREQSGKLFDPIVVKVFLETMNDYQ